MRWKGTYERYGAVPVIVHWTTAILIIVLIVSGLRAAGITDPAVRRAF
jgi:cytochrome b561